MAHNIIGDEQAENFNPRNAVVTGPLCQNEQVEYESTRGKLQTCHKISVHIKSQYKSPQK